MPWWAYSYLGIYFSLTILDIYDNAKLPKRLVYVSSDVLCAAFVTICVLAYFNQNVYSLIGSSILMLVGVGVLIESISSLRDLGDAKKDPDITDSERHRLTTFAISVVVLIAAPGYILGILAYMKYK
ncbi:MAG: hypothetical protein VCC01_01885 [Candidatus Hydrogenedentota bacterium]